MDTYKHCEILDLSSFPGKNGVEEDNQKTKSSTNSDNNNHLPNAEIQNSLRNEVIK